MSTGVIHDLPEILIRASLAMAITATGIMLMLRSVNLRSPALHRLAWLVVLIQGCIFTRIAWEIPWYEPVARACNQVEEPITGDAGIVGAVFGETESLLVDHDGSDGPASAISGAPAEPTRGESANPDPVGGGPSLMVDRPWSVAANGWLPAGWQGMLQPPVAGTIFLVVWLGGVAVLPGICLASYFSLLISLRRTGPAPAAWADQWTGILKQAGVDSSVPFRVHPGLGPLLCRTPRGYQLVVPGELWEELDDRQRAAVLNHELAHLLRGDIWKSFVARLLALPHWFNPIAWLAVRKFEESGEWACDRYLIGNDPLRGAAFAEALLRIVQFPRPAGVGFSNAGGSLLRERIRRLCGVHQVEDSVVKRVTSILLLTAVFVLGLAEFRLVERAMAQDQQAVTGDSPGEARQEGTDREKIEQLSERLAGVGEDPLVSEFRKVLDSGPGQTALLERASRLQQAARQAAQENALPAFLEKHFQRADGQLVLKPDQADFADAFVKQAGLYRQDVDQIQAALADCSRQLADTNEAEKILQRLLDHPLAAWVIYATEAGRRMRPDERTILELYQSVFVVAPDGQLIVRPAVRTRVEEQLVKGTGRRQALDRVDEELQLLSREIADVDEAHRRLKEIFADEYFAAFCCFDSIGQDGDPDKGLENLFNFLDRILEDHGDGLRLNDEGRQTAEQRFAAFANRREAAERLREPLERFAGRIPAGYDALHDRVRQAFDSRLVLAMLTANPTMRATTGAQYVQSSLEQQLSMGDDGRWHVLSDREDQVIEYARRLLKTTRILRRRMAAVDDQIDQIQDDRLREVFATPAGKYVMLRSLTRQMDDRQFDGLGLWIDQHFTETGDGWALKEESRGEISELLEQVNKIQTELKKDDF